MSTVDSHRLAPAASRALVDALLHRSSYSFWSDRPALVLHAVTEPVVRALLAVLVGVTVEEWDGPTSGDGFRTYRGVLPCGLPLELVTCRDEVPNLLTAQGGLDTATDDKRAGERG